MILLACKSIKQPQVFRKGFFLFTQQLHLWNWHQGVCNCFIHRDEGFCNRILRVSLHNTYYHGIKTPMLCWSIHKAPLLLPSTQQQEYTPCSSMGDAPPICMKLKQIPKIMLVTLTWTASPGDSVTFVGETLNKLGSWSTRNINFPCLEPVLVRVNCWEVIWCSHTKFPKSMTEGQTSKRGMGRILQS